MASANITDTEKYKGDKYLVKIMLSNTGKFPIQLSKGKPTTFNIKKIDAERKNHTIDLNCPPVFSPQTMTGIVRNPRYGMKTAPSSGDAKNTGNNKPNNDFTGKEKEPA